MKRIPKIIFIVLLLITIVCAILLITTDKYFEILFPILFIFSMLTLTTFLTSSDFE